MAEYVFATDGSGDHYKSLSKQAGYACVFANLATYNKAVILYGPVPKYRIISACIENGKLATELSNEAETPTNNRGELFGILAAVKLAEFYKAKFTGKNVTIISDSKYCINTLTVWLANWKREHREHLQKNMDIISIIDETINNSETTFTFRHEKAHKSLAAKRNITGEDLKRNNLNEMADKYALIGKNSDISSADLINISG